MFSRKIHKIIKAIILSNVLKFMWIAIHIQEVRIQGTRIQEVHVIIHVVKTQAAILTMLDTKNI